MFAVCTAEGQRAVGRGAVRNRIVGKRLGPGHVAIPPREQRAYLFWNKGN